MILLMPCWLFLLGRLRWRQPANSGVSAQVHLSLLGSSLLSSGEGFIDRSLPHGTARGEEPEEFEGLLAAFSSSRNSDLGLDNMFEIVDLLLLSSISCS